jgi:hypothetical protein
MLSSPAAIVCDHPSGRQPRNRRRADVVAAGDVGKRLALLAALDRLALLVFGPARVLAAPSPGSCLLPCGCGLRSRSTTASPPSTAIIKRLTSERNSRH